MGRLDDVLARGTVSAADGTKKMRVVQVRLLADEVRDDLEHVEPYGFTSEPLDDEQPEAFAAFFSGDRSHGIVFCIADRRYRLTKLKAGEVALYDDQGQKVHLTRDGIVVHTDKQLEATVGGTLTATVSGAATLKAASVKIDAPTVELTGALKVAKLITGTGGMAISGGSGAAVTGDIKVSGGDVTADGISLQNHTHDFAERSPSDSHGQNFAGHVVLGLADYLGGIGRLCPSSADRMVCMRKRSWN